MVQVPVLTSVAVVPETVQTVVVSDAKLTGRPELADALRASFVPCTWLGIGLKVMVWLVFVAVVTVTVTMLEVDEGYVPLPEKVAVTELAPDCSAEPAT